MTSRMSRRWSRVLDELPDTCQSRGCGERPQFPVEFDLGEDVDVLALCAIHTCLVVGRNEHQTVAVIGP